MRIRRGPATVTGDADRTRAGARRHWDATTAAREGAGRVGPGARRPASDRQAHTPSWKGVAPCSIDPSSAQPSRCARWSRAAVAQAAPVTVTVRVEGATTTVFEVRVTTDHPRPATSRRTPRRTSATAPTRRAAPAPSRSVRRRAGHGRRGARLRARGASARRRELHGWAQPVGFDAATGAVTSRRVPRRAGAASSRG